ncbi:serine hydrolase [Acidisoma cellulosilytica]|uniref:Serine hydrolase n=1 Tax=Acidisoma cellulosilyticum TaxID=2802395 RepID=A0A963Z3C3_9PROT|nr:serine hydrolase [Acidisoma cellulosilyticum]MCB8881217.1 serine hydrolase [Acidisoma cellulosilyticum]
MANKSFFWLFGSGILAAGLMAGQASAAPPPPAIDNSVSPPEMVGVPIPPGQIDKAVAQLDGLIAQIMQKTGIPGLAVAVVHNGQTVYAKGFGVRRVGSPDKVDADTVFQLASLSKAVGATVIAREVGQHVVTWNTPIVKHLPWFALGDPWVTQHVTIGDMYAHRSGLPDHAGDELEDLGYTQRQVLDRLRYLPLASFRDTYAYTNFGITAAAEAVAAASGKDWATLSDDAIYRPLGMNVTSSRFADFEKRPDKAVGHVLVDGVYAAKYQRQPDAQSPAGGVSSSVNDMAHWMAMVMQDGVYDAKPVIDPDALLPAVTGEIVAAHSASVTARPGLYGYGFNVGTQPSGRTTISHSGAFALGAATSFMIIPSAGIGIVTLSNASPIGAVEALNAMFADLVQFGYVSRDWLHDYGRVIAPLMAPQGTLAGKTPPANPAPAKPLADYVGDYGNDYFGTAHIVQRGGALVLVLGPKSMDFPLRHWDGDIFAYTPSGENAPAGSIGKVQFTSGPTGKASALDIDLYAETGRNHFLRR